MLTALFDDHYEAFVVWREAGLTGLTCLHVDAHLDVSTDGFTAASLQGIAQARTREELSAFRGNPKLPWGGFHCGNYLYPALLDGTVTTLIWVVPRDFGEGAFLSSARQTLQNWIDLTLEEYRSLRLVEGRVEGTVLGRRLVICHSHTMPPLSDEESSRLALDIDVDYFVRLRDDRMWQTPHQLRRELGPIQPLVLTVATSCGGGYTPLAHRHLGQVCLDVFRGQSDAWLDETLAYQEAMALGWPLPKPQPELRRPALESPAEPASEAAAEPEPEVASLTREEAEAERREALERLLEGASPVLRPALLCALGRFDEAQALSAEYRRSPYDEAGRFFQKRQYQEGLRCLEEAGEGSLERGFMVAFMAVGNAQPELSLDEIDKLLAQPGLTDRDQARLLALQAEVLGAEQPRRALEVLARSLKIESDRPGPHHLMAQYLRQSGRREEAARAVRKALRLSKGRVSSLPILLDAARLYDEMGQKALARATRRELEDADVTGYYAIQSVLDTAR